MKQKSIREERHHSLVRFNSSSSNILSYIHPWIPLWWSAAFPGYGHFLIGNNVTAFILICFEFVVNNMAHINDAIYRSMLGDFKGAKEILNLRWFFGYIAVYTFAMYDSYRRAVEYNKIYLLAYRYTKKRSFSALSTISLNTIELTSPSNGFFWSFLTPGLGAVYTQRLPTFIFSLLYWGVTAIQSHWFEATFYTFIGNFERAKDVLNPQWLLFIPSITGFAMYYSYRETVNANKQFKLSQSQFFKESYQSNQFVKPV